MHVAIVTNAVGEAVCSVTARFGSWLVNANRVSASQNSFVNANHVSTSLDLLSKALQESLKLAQYSDHHPYIKSLTTDGKQSAAHTVDGTDDIVQAMRKIKWESLA